MSGLTFDYARGIWVPMETNADTPPFDEQALWDRLFPGPADEVAS